VSENLKKLVELYNIKVSESLEKAKTRLDQFNSTREQALKFSTPIDDAYKTLGDLVAKMIGPTGEIDSQLYEDFIIYGIAPDDEKKLIKSLYSAQGAPATYKAVQAQQKAGGVSFFNGVMQELGKEILAGAVKFDELIGKNSNDPDTKKILIFSEYIEDIVSGSGLSFPNGVIDSPELYYAVVENGNPIGKKEGAGPINEKAEETPGEPSTAINEPKKETKSGGAASALNPEKKEAAPTVIESSAVTTAPAEMPKEPEPPASPASPGIIVNVEPTPPSLPKPEGTAATVAAQPSATTINESSTVSTTNVSNVAQSSVINQPKTEISQGGTAGPTTQQKTEIVNNESYLSKYLGFLGQDTVKALEGAVNKRETVSTINDKKGSKSVKSPEDAVKGESPITETKMSDLGAKKKFADAFKGYTGINLEKTAAEKEAEKRAIIAKETAATAINEELSKKEMQLSEPSQEKSEKSSSSTETTSAAPSLTEAGSITDVTKTLPTLPEKQKSDSPEKIEPDKAAASPSKEDAVSVKEVMPDTAAGATPTQSMSAPAASGMGVDMSGVEQRLARLELLLSGTLDVRIID
jgi:hypothetical protein